MSDRYIVRTHEAYSAGGSVVTEIRVVDTHYCYRTVTAEASQSGRGRLGSLSYGQRTRAHALCDRLNREERDDHV